MRGRDPSGATTDGFRRLAAGSATGDDPSPSASWWLGIPVTATGSIHGRSAGGARNAADPVEPQRRTLSAADPVEPQRRTLSAADPVEPQRRTLSAADPVEPQRRTLSAADPVNGVRMW